jgi:hypothetical protein
MTAKHGSYEQLQEVNIKWNVFSKSLKSLQVNYLLYTTQKNFKHVQIIISNISHLPHPFGRKYYKKINQ